MAEARESDAALLLFEEVSNRIRERLSDAWAESGARSC